MRLQKLGHSCLLVEDAVARLLLDPGCFSEDLSDIDGLTGVLVTHVHDDHLDVTRLLDVLKRNPSALIVCDEASAAVLADHGVTSRVVREGDRLDMGMPVDVFGRQHAPIHPELPDVPNVGYLIADRFFFAGDAFTIPDRPIDVLAVPVGGAWMKAAEAIDWLRAVHPRHVVPVHDHGNVFAPWICQLFAELGPPGAAVTVLDRDPVAF
ncbi:MAG: hypothetical protein QOI54_2519 [Actinomycetota bacterium]|jgi:L-ascorbate metabolism protein UlaG (beta-lactamase superfamily)|nr:hypothetical protein [Actinomycetota bacterium]